MKRWIYKLIAVISLGMAVLGIILPGLPATEFILLAAWAAAKGSPRIHSWIMSWSYCREIVENWQNGKVVSRKNKIHSALSMTACFVILLIAGVPQTFVIIALLGMLVGSYFIWIRPELPSHQ
ncbi:YbaN family protein [Vibrio salinus]|uniref:YbaN family protein n=1 Tax=Vibrio salinus TaxID=2899784 RepID=UPI001E4E1E90|nr:YbaN family protein [Vibrio salinus]MCE0495905.1 YbaN family protein [Vibrio salinus]